MIEAKVTDASGNDYGVKVTKNGQLVVGQLSFDETSFMELAEDDTAYNFYVQKKGKQFIITGLNFKADRQVSGTVDADVIIYEATSATSTVVSKVLFQDAMVKGESTSLSGLNILVSEGMWVNAKTTDDDIHMTIMGYYIDKL